MVITDVKPSDFNKLFDIRNNNFFDPEIKYSDVDLTRLSSQGFLLSRMTFEDFKECMITNKSFVFRNESLMPKGYIRIDEYTKIQNYDFDKDDQVVVENKQIFTGFYDIPHAELGALVVSSEWRGKSVGRKLRTHALDYLVSKGYKDVYTYVVLEPILNQPSIRLQELMGFKRIALVKYRWGFYNFCVGLFHKKLTYNKRY